MIGNGEADSTSESSLSLSSLQFSILLVCLIFTSTSCVSRRTEATLACSLALNSPHHSAHVIPATLLVRSCWLHRHTSFLTCRPVLSQCCQRKGETILSNHGRTNSSQRDGTVLAGRSRKELEMNSLAICLTINNGNICFDNGSFSCLLGKRKGIMGKLKFGKPSAACLEQDRIGFLHFLSKRFLFKGGSGNDPALRKSCHWQKL